MSRREKRQTRPQSLIGPPPGPPPLPMQPMPYDPYFAGPPPGAPYNYPPPIDPRHIPPPSAPFPPPAAPQAPNSGQQTPYSTHPPSPTSSSENLSYQAYPAPAHHHGIPAPPPQFYDDMGPYPPHMPHGKKMRDPRGPPPPPPAPPSGDGRRNNANPRPAIHHYDTEPDYRLHPRLAPHDMSPPSESSGDRGGAFMVIPGTGGAVHRSASYHPGIGSGFSDGSYEGGDLRHGMQQYMISSGSQHGRRRKEKEREYQLNRTPSLRESEGGRKVKQRRERPVSMYQLEGPPRRADSRRDAPSEVGTSRPPAPQAPGSDDGRYDEPSAPLGRQSRGMKRIANESGPTSAGALIRRRSRSVSDHGSQSHALVRRRSDDELALAPPPPNTIRLEVGGQAIDITYTGTNGKPLVGNITINTTARTIEPAPQPPPPPQQQALPAPPAPEQQDDEKSRSPSPPPAPAPLAILPPGIQPVMIPAPPPLQPMEQALARIQRPATEPQLSQGPSPPLHACRDVREDLYHNMESLALSQTPPSHHPSGYLEHDMMPPTPSRGPPGPPGHDAEGPPLWTKISRDIVSKRAVLVQGYAFEEQGDKIMIRHLLNEQEIDDLVALSDEIRSGKKEVIRLSEAERQDRSRRNREDRDRRDRDRRDRDRDRDRERERDRDHDRHRRHRSSSRRPPSIASGPGAFPASPSRSPSRSPSPSPSLSSVSSRSPSPEPRHHHRSRHDSRRRPRDPLDPGPSKERPAPLKPALRPAPPEAPAPPPAGGEDSRSEDISPPPPPPVEVVKMEKPNNNWGDVWKYAIEQESGGVRGGSRRNKGDGGWYEVSGQRDAGPLKENLDMPGTYVGYTRTPGR